MTLPPGQIETKRFPVVGERSPSAELSLGWSLSVIGLVETQMTMTFDDYLGLEHADLVFDIHCVTSWTRLDSVWRGVPLSRILAPLPNARFVSFTAYSERDHHTSLPLAVVLGQCWLVHEFDGEPLQTSHGGPVRVVTPGKYFYKSLKWVKTIEVMAEDRLGWWETNSSYHNNADPWAGSQRFTTGSIRPEQLRRFLDTDNYDKYRGRVLLGLDLRRWSPRSPNLGRLHLKNCDLRGVDLSGTDLRNANLSLSDLTGANLAGADLSGSDLEGAILVDAHLTGADLSGTALSAARFEGAEVSGARFDGCWGLIESQHAYLVQTGAAL